MVDSPRFRAELLEAQLRRKVPPHVPRVVGPFAFLANDLLAD